MKQLDRYDRLNLNVFQLREIQIAFQNGLTEDQVDVFATGEFDSLQMKEIRLGYEMGLTQEQILSYANPAIDADAMNHMRISIDRNTGLSEKKRADLNQKKWKTRMMIAVFILTCISIGISAILVNEEAKLYFQKLNLVLVDDTIELQTGEAFYPMEYVSEYTQDENVELILPEGIDTTHPGCIKVMYKLKNKRKIMMQQLFVSIVDRTAPKLTLTTDEITLTAGIDQFDAMQYVACAVDEADGDLIQEVEVSALDLDQQEQIIEYRVQDHSGNQTQAYLKVSWVEQKQTVPEYPLIEDPQPQWQQPETDPTPPSSKAGQTASFMFSQGYDIDSAFAACKAEGDSYGGSYACEPVVEDDLYVGYLLSYR